MWNIETPGCVYVISKKIVKKSLKILQKSVDFVERRVYTNIAFHKSGMQKNNNNWIV